MARARKRSRASGRHTKESTVPPLSPHFLEIFDAAGQPRGVLLSPELWSAVKAQVAPILNKALPTVDPTYRPEPVERPEPMDEWNTLLAYWDFAYQPTRDVACEHCGNATPDWTLDTPRKFRLRTANLGGQVTFQCQACRAMILKKHFKKHVAVECLPYVDKG
jgi:hypothetical protein